MTIYGTKVEPEPKINNFCSDYAKSDSEPNLEKIFYQQFKETFTVTGNT